MRAAYGHGFVDAAPDPTVPGLLRELLREDRDRWGFDFDSTWDDDLAFVLARVRGRLEREAWREAFESTRAAWEAAYNRVDGPGQRLTQALIESTADNPLPAPELAA